MPFIPLISCSIGRLVLGIAAANCGAATVLAAPTLYFFQE